MHICGCKTYLLNFVLWILSSLFLLFFYECKNFSIMKKKTFFYIIYCFIICYKLYRYLSGWMISKMIPIKNFILYNNIQFMKKIFSSYFSDWKYAFLFKIIFQIIDIAYDHYNDSLQGKHKIKSHNLSEAPLTLRTESVQYLQNY